MTRPHLSRALGRLGAAGAWLAAAACAAEVLRDTALLGPTGTAAATLTAVAVFAVLVAVSWPRRRPGWVRANPGRSPRARRVAT